MASQDPEPDLFGHIVGRALLDDNFRDQLLHGDNEARTAALESAGLTAAQAEAILPELATAAQSITDLANHDAFGIRPYAA